MSQASLRLATMSTTAAPSIEASPTTPAIYKMIVRSAEEAVETIRAKWGDQAKVLSVRQVPGDGLASLFRRPRLEVIAQLGEAPSAPSEPVAADSRLPAEPSVTSADEAAARERLEAVRAIAPGAGRDRSPRLPDLLRRSGFSETMLARLAATPGLAPVADVPLHRALADLGAAVRSSTAARAVRPLPGRVAFLGTAGSGRTTALCKWLARRVFTDRATGRVLKAEFDRPNPGEGLAVFCEALGLTLEHIGAEGSSSSSADEAPGFVYADLPALSVRRPSDNAALGRCLARERLDGRVLVLNAVYDLAALRAAYSVGRDLGATHLVFTHLDELNHWGKLWDFLVEGDLTPLFLATGPSLTGDLEEDAVGALLRKTLPGA